MSTRRLSRFASTIPLSLCAAGLLMFAACSSDSKGGDEEEADASTNGATETNGATGTSGATGSQGSDGNSAHGGLDGSVVTTPPSHPGTSGDKADGAVTPSDDGGAPVALLDAGLSTPDAGGETPADAGHGKLCGTRGAPQGCGPMQFCSFATGTQCGAADQGGMCKPRPQVCEQTCMPERLCGCDGRTYCNECLAESAGTSVAHAGACEMTPPTTGKTCGGIAGLKCDSGMFCDYEASAGGQGCSGRIADAAGKCQPIPASCQSNPRNPRGPMAQPVCGCDGKTYPSACEAHLKGVSVNTTGACK